jgi:uncharacterized membrane protein
LQHPGFKTGLVLVVMLAKAAYCMFATLRWIHHTVTSAYHQKYMVGFLATQMLLIVLSFAIDYYCLYQIDGSAFRILDAPQRSMEQFLVFLYFSLGKYTTAGVGDIHPVSPVARLCAMGEMVVAYFTTVLIIANVRYLQVFFGKKKKGQEA